MPTALPSPKLTLWALAATVWASGCASPPVPVEPAAAYSGRFESGCAMLVENTLYFNDTVELKPQGRTVKAVYRKGFFSKPGCEVSGLIATLTLPEATWELQDQVDIDGQRVDRVVVTLQTGLLSAEVAPTGKITETEKAIILHYGKDQKVPVTRLTEGSVDKDLRKVTAKQLFIGDIESPKKDGYPSALEANLVFDRVPSAP